MTKKPAFTPAVQKEQEFFDPELHMEVPQTALDGLYALQDKGVQYSEYLVYCMGVKGNTYSMFDTVLKVLDVYELKPLDLAKLLAKHIREKQAGGLFSATENTREDAA